MSNQCHEVQDLVRACNVAYHHRLCQHLYVRSIDEMYARQVVYRRQYAPHGSVAHVVVTYRPHLSLTHISRLPLATYPSPRTLTIRRPSPSARGATVALE